MHDVHTRTDLAAATRKEFSGGGGNKMMDGVQRKVGKGGSARNRGKAAFPSNLLSFHP
jgi:hypothetical protein